MWTYLTETGSTSMEPEGTIEWFDKDGNILDKGWESLINMVMTHGLIKGF